MATIYKLKVNNKVSKRNYTLGGARALRKHYEQKGLKNVKVIVWEENQMIVDTTSDYMGVIEHYRKPTEKEYKQMLKTQTK